MHKNKIIHRITFTDKILHVNISNLIYAFEMNETSKLKQNSHVKRPPKNERITRDAISMVVHVFYIILFLNTHALNL